MLLGLTFLESCFSCSATAALAAAAVLEAVEVGCAEDSSSAVGECMGDLEGERPKVNSKQLTFLLLIVVTRNAKLVVLLLLLV